VSWVVRALPRHWRYGIYRRGVYLAIGEYYSMNCFDHLFWALAIYILVRILKGGDARLWCCWVWCGPGLENKYSMGFFGAGLIVGLALTRARVHFLNKWLWVGGALAAVIFLPHVLWKCATTSHG